MVFSILSSDLNLFSIAPLFRVELSSSEAECCYGFGWTMMVL